MIVLRFGVGWAKAREIINSTGMEKTDIDDWKIALEGHAADVGNSKAHGHVRFWIQNFKNPSDVPGGISGWTSGSEMREKEREQRAFFKERGFSEEEIEAYFRKIRGAHDPREDK